MIDYSALTELGMAGVFIGYLIYDRQVILKKVIKSIDKNTEVLNGIVQSKQFTKGSNKNPKN